jgi:hypothetical protein
MTSMNPGKGMAQASHAANQFVHTFSKARNPEYRKRVKDWQNQSGNGFGTVIVLGGTWDDIVAAVESNLLSGLVIDPSYPIRDGDVTHHLSIGTCGFVFVQDRSNARNLDNFVLHP